MIKEEEIYDVAVIGGGPAGMMAAGRAAELGAKVILLERNKTLGRKLLLTGNERCNITRAGLSDKEFIKKLGKNGSWFFSALAAFGSEDIMEFFAERGLKIKIEEDGRVFPASDHAQDVLNILLSYLLENNVKILCQERVLKFSVKNKQIESVELMNGRKINARHFILCSGGAAYPATGSSGDGYEFAQKLGHKIISPRPALAPIEILEGWAKELPGLGLKNVEVRVWQNNKKQESARGDIIFTHYGISGPRILDLSKKISELALIGKVIIEIDLRPELDSAQMDKWLRKNFAANANRYFKNYMFGLMPQRMAEVFIDLLGINPKKKINLITREERKAIAGLLKGLKLTARGSMGFEQANVTSGGVNLAEIDSKTMKSKIIKNLFFAGEIIDLDGPTGGYNLQICWTTGFAAGNNVML